MKKIKILTHQKFQAVLFVGKDKKQVYVKWRTPMGCEVKEWDDHKDILEHLLTRVRLYCVSEDLTLWSY